MSQPDISGRTLLVTGASRGIGLAVTERLHAAGARVIGVSRNPPRTALPERVEHVRMDLSDLDALPNALRALAATHRDIDGVVLNAGAGHFGALEQFSASRVRELVELNLISPMLIARELIPRLKRRGYGDLVFIGSESSLRGGRRGAVYSATKFGVRGFVQSLRDECAASGVRVGIVNPGMVDTSFFDGLDFRPGSATDQHLQPDDVAEAVLLMLSARPGTVVDEINLSPAKHVIEFGRQDPSGSSET